MNVGVRIMQFQEETVGVTQKQSQNEQTLKKKVEECSDFKIKNCSLSNEPTKKSEIIRYGVRRDNYLS